MPIVTNGLSLHLDAANPSSYPGSGSVWHDLTGNHFNFNAGDGDPIANNVGRKSLYINGTPLTSNIIGTTFEQGQFTYEVWINSDNLNGNILSERNQGGWYVSLMDIVGGDVRVGFWNSGTAYTSAGTITTGTWNQIVLKFNNGVLTGYVNGVPSTPVNTGKEYPGQYSFVVLADYEPTNFGYGNPFIGKVSDIRFYNRALTDEEVLQNYNATLNTTKPKSIRFQKSSKIQSIPPTAYKYYKWHITQTKYHSDAFTQASEFRFCLDGTPTDMSSVTLSLLNGHISPPSEQVINLKDSSVYSKFLDLSFESGGTEVLFEFPTAQIFNGYQWATANDVTGRDPKNWTIYGSNDNSNWTLLDTVTNYMATDSRWAYTGVFSFQNGLDANSIPNTITITPNIKNGLTPKTAGDSAYQIKRDFPASTDGLYWIKNGSINGGHPFQIYADMTTDGGGWTLLLTNAANAGWTIENAISNDTFSPSLDANYSIVSWGDYLKKSQSGFQYMIEADTRGNWGGIWTANGNYSFVANNNSQTNITLNIRFGSWNYNDSGIEERMPWYSANYYPTLTTNHNGYSDANWWGTLVTVQPVWTTAPWIAAGMANPTRIWYWVR